ncbi:hypothetical protein D9M68_863020 [compost metagenome]
MIFRRTGSVTASKCMPRETTPLSFRRWNQRSSSGGSHWAWIGRSTAAVTAAAASQRMAAPRSRVCGVPVVITMCFTPSSSTAAFATSASCAGRLRAMVLPAASDWPIAQNWQEVAASFMRTQCCNSVVASTSRLCRVAIFQ